MFVFRWYITEIILFTTDMVIMLVTVKRYNIRTPLTRTDAASYVSSISTHRYKPGLWQYWLELPRIRQLFQLLIDLFTYASFHLSIPFPLFRAWDSYNNVKSILHFLFMHFHFRYFQWHNFVGERLVAGITAANLLIVICSKDWTSLLRHVQRQRNWKRCVSMNWAFIR